MARGCITFVGIKSVLRIFFVELAHQPVAMDLGDYGSRSNGNGKAVSLRYSLLNHGERELVWTVDQEKIRLYSQRADSAGHGPEGCLEDIYPVYFNVVYNSDADSQRARPDLEAKIFPLLRGEFLGIGDPGETKALLQDNGCGNNGACQRSTACLVYTANKTKTPPVGISFMKTHVNRQGFDQLPLHEARLEEFGVSIPRMAGSKPTTKNQNR